MISMILYCLNLDLKDLKDLQDLFIKIFLILYIFLILVQTKINRHPAQSHCHPAQFPCHTALDAVSPDTSDDARSSRIKCGMTGTKIETTI